MIRAIKHTLNTKNVEQVCNVNKLKQTIKIAQPFCLHSRYNSSMSNITYSTEVPPSTKQDGLDCYENGRFALNNNANPTGKGGFSDHPENRNSGHWDKENSLSYWYNKIMRMTDGEFDKWKPNNRAQRIALKVINMALGDDEDLALKATKEITDRTEGRPKQSIDLDLEYEQSIPIIRGFVIPTLPEHFIDKDIIEQLGEEEGVKYLK